jgi:hypothetical protein
MLSTLGEIIRDLLIVVGFITIMLAGLLFVIVRMPTRSPLKTTLTALCLRLAATIVAGMLAIPIEPIAGLDVVYDVGAPIMLLLYWISFFNSARWKTSPPPARRTQHNRLQRDLH